MTIPYGPSHHADQSLNPSGHPGDKYVWIGSHVHFRGDLHGFECDRLLRVLVQPVIDELRRGNLIRRSFFVRYSEGGNHLRVRMLLAPEASAERLVGEYTRISERIAQTARSGIATTSRWVDYRPELERYGGTSATQTAESLFADSSTAALKLLSDDLVSERPIRLGRAMMATVATLFAFFDERVKAQLFARRYSEAQLVQPRRDHTECHALRAAFDSRLSIDGPNICEQITGVWTALEGWSISGALDPYCDALRRYRRQITALISSSLVSFAGKTPSAWCDAAGPLASSIVHMMNNRMGLTRDEESFLGHLIHRALGAN